ncbi:hypothetical protein [Rhizobium sp. WW_1]|jgi:hypothetical protein|uniref:hypothetical protein n=1 Tax=Rhizobium sp. WW_1 TaxID=1907375 RepID=UPI0006467D9D|nr:hypothetical protein [Rhizobium sp. WW_1]RKD68997.1 hypothetical protein BJ928_104135 [Rhizobium sp. WW_1]
MQPRFDGHRYRDCRWCGGRGCLQCEGEANKAYKAAFPDGPKPIATFKLPEDIDAARGAIGAEALQKAFGAGGGGIAEIMQNLANLQKGNGS